jgi:hypothetical protein
MTGIPGEYATTTAVCAVVVRRTLLARAPDVKVQAAL